MWRIKWTKPLWIAQPLLLREPYFCKIRMTGSLYRDLLYRKQQKPLHREGWLVPDMSPKSESTKSSDTLHGVFISPAWAVPMSKAFGLHTSDPMTFCESLMSLTPRFPVPNKARSRAESCVISFFLPLSSWRQTAQEKAGGASASQSGQRWSRDPGETEAGGILQPPMLLLRSFLSAS